MFKKDLKRVITLMLSACMVIGSVTGCGSDDTESTPSSSATSQSSSSSTQSSTSGSTSGDATQGGDAVEATVNDTFSVDYENNTVYVGATTAILNSAEAGSGIGYDVFSGVSGKDYTDTAVYTYNDYISGTSNMKWSTHTWETSSDSYVLDFISGGFYGYALNSTADGWSITCDMAAELPVDVTSEWVGKYGIEAGDTAQAWKIALNPDACWEDGTPINADSYIYSYKELLDPDMLNRRADSLYAGDFVIYNAMEYIYQGASNYLDNAVNSNYAIADLTKGEDGVYCTPTGNKMYIALDMAIDWCGGNSLKDYVDAYGTTYFDVTNWETLVGMMDENGLIPLTDENIALFTPVITGNPAWGETEAELPNYLAECKSYADGLSFDEVGIVKTGDYELVFITTAPVADPDYYVPYNLSSTYLVYEPLWESCKSYFDADGNQVTADSDNIARITTNYCTTADTTMSYGPYRLDYFELDKQITFTRNENWYGYKDGKHLGQYQTDIISCQVIAEHATALLAFLNGEIDSISLQADDMESYGTSSYIRYTPQSYTTKLTFNTNLESLTSRGTQILTNAYFRKAFAFSLDRQTFATAYTSAGSAGYGLLNYMYMYDPMSGGVYRETDGAKRALVELYELTYGDDGEYGDLEEAYEAITGYDVNYAKELMAKAYDECVADGLYDGSSNIEITVSMYSDDDIYIQMFNFFQDALKAAVAGTGFEGKVSFKMVVDPDYYDTMYSGGTDMIFSTWGGAASSPYTMLDQVYCDAADGSGNQMEYGYETDKIMVTMVIDGNEFTQSLQKWAAWMGNDQEAVITSKDGSVTLEPFANYDNETKADLHGRMEYAYLSFFTTTPMYYRNSASLVSQKGDYPLDSYIDLIGFGGLKFYTYNYNDTEWAGVKGSLKY